MFPLRINVGVTHRHLSDHLSEVVENTLTDLEQSKVNLHFVMCTAALHHEETCLRESMLLFANFSELLMLCTIKLLSLFPFACMCSVYCNRRWDGSVPTQPGDDCCLLLHQLHHYRWVPPHTSSPGWVPPPTSSSVWLEDHHITFPHTTHLFPPHTSVYPYSLFLLVLVPNSPCRALQYVPQ